MADTERLLEQIARLETVQKCETFEQNALKKDRPDLAVAARKRAVEIRAAAHGAKSKAERECIEAIYAYEQVLSARNQRKTSASRTWPMVERHGIIGAVERAVCRKDETLGYAALAEMGLEDYAFEAVVVRYPKLFSAEAIAQSQARIAKRSR